MIDNPNDVTSPKPLPAEDELEWKPLPGAVLVAERMERRRFIRRVSSNLFLGFVAVSSGATTLFGFLADPAKATIGGCCPNTNNCCGPSPCCNTSCCSKPCCTLGSDQCANNGSTCLGIDTGDWSPSNCWSCTNNTTGITVVCCDCKTNNQTGCTNSIANRCICYFVGHFAPPRGVRNFVNPVSPPIP